MQLFYENKLFFGYCCVGAEFFYIFLYTVCQLFCHILFVLPNNFSVKHVSLFVFLFASVNTRDRIDCFEL